MILLFNSSSYDNTVLHFILCSGLLACHNCDFFFVDILRVVRNYDL